MGSLKRYEDFKEIVWEIGEVGLEMTQLGSVEGSAGNLSVFTRTLRGLDASFVQQTVLDLPVKVPALAGGWVVITGTGRRLRDVRRAPGETLCALHILPGGEKAEMFAEDPELRPTIECNSHLAVHNYQVEKSNLDFHAVVHAQPLNITYLSHRPEYGDTRSMTMRLIPLGTGGRSVFFPEGIGIVPFQVPGSAGQMEGTFELMKTHRLVMWQGHGTVSRSEKSIFKAGGPGRVRRNGGALRSAEPENG